MDAFLSFFSNIDWLEIWLATGDTLMMLGGSLLFTVLLGLPLGVLLVAVVIFATGLFVANMFGQWWLRQWDRILVRIPVVRSIYSSVKQVADTLFSGSGKAFSKALLVQYPRQGSWSVGFFTGAPSGEVSSHLSGEHVSVFIPTTPNPTSGFFLIVPRSDVIELRMSVDEALKYIISMGVVAPPSKIKNHMGTHQKPNL